MAHLLAIPEQKTPVEIYCPSDVPYWEIKLIRLSSSFLLHNRMEEQNEAEKQRNPFVPTELAGFNQPFYRLGREIQPVQDTGGAISVEQTPLVPEIRLPPNPGATLCVFELPEN